MGGGGNEGTRLGCRRDSAPVAEARARCSLTCGPLRPAVSLYSTNMVPTISKMMLNYRTPRGHSLPCFYLECNASCFQGWLVSRRLGFPVNALGYSALIDEAPKHFGVNAHLKWAPSKPG